MDDNNGAQMNYKYPFFSLVLGIIALGLMPFGMSQVQTEPSMEIDMIVGQTQNPFRIQDESNQNIFVVQPDGTIREGQNHQFNLQSDLGEEITLTDCLYEDYGYVANATLGNDCIFAEIDITILDTAKYNAGWFIPIHNTFQWTDIKRDAGAGTCKIDIQVQEKGDNFYSSTPAYGSLTTTSATYDDRISFTGYVDAYTSAESIRIAFDTGNDSTTCTYKNISYFFEIPNFVWYDLTEVKNGL